MQRRHLPLYDRAFGSDAARWRQASPVDVLDAKAIPMLAVCSTRRPDHPCVQAQAYAQRAGTLGRITRVSEQDLDHEGINRELGLPGAYTAEVDRFMASLGAVGRAAVRR
jgi:hypothetical protein